MARSCLIAALIVVGACSFDGNLGPGYRCGIDGSCPEDQVCVAGHCMTSAPEPDANPGAIDAAPDPDGPAAALRCGTLELVQDDFEDGVIGWEWDAWGEVNEATAVEVGGEAVVQLIQGTEDMWAGFTTAVRYDFIDGVFEAEVVGVGGVVTLIEVNAFGPGKAQLVVDSGLLGAAVYETSNNGVRVEVPYSATTHRYWRMRESGGTFFWETSPDRIVWNELHSEPISFPVGHVKGMLAAGGQLSAGPSEARFGDVNLEAQATRVYCPVSDLVDRFDDGPSGPTWSTYTAAGCTIMEIGGQLTMAFDGVGSDSCGLDSEHLYDLRNSSITIDAAGVPGAPMFLTYLQAGALRDGSTRLEIERKNDILDIEQQVGGVDIDQVQLPYNTVDHRWWRMRESAGDILFETSPDGAAWTVRLTSAAAFDLSAVAIELGASSSTPGPGAAQVVTVPGVN